ncbi:MAG: hypothetical protein WCO37_00325 [Bacteroidota bacterium]
MKSKLNKIIAAILIYNLGVFSLPLGEGWGGAVAQTIPNAVNFQAIARNAVGSLITNSNVQVKIEVLDGSSSGPVMVTLVYTPTTDAYGQFNFAIGAGSPVVTAGTVANFAAIDWASSAKFIKVSLSPLADNNYTLISNTQATASFYAFGAKTAEKVNITGTNGQVLKHNGTTWVAGTDAGSTFIAPTVQRFTSGSGTYARSAGVLYIEVELVGGGGGGSTASFAGGSGSSTTFGTSLLTANGGAGAAANINGRTGGVGGTTTVNAPAITLVAITGSAGGAGSRNSTSDHSGNGGATPFGGAGGGGTTADPESAQKNGIANSGSGGGGKSASGPGGGGGAGGYIKALITSPNATYTYSIGAGGSSSTGVGGSGVIIVKEYYQ